MKINLPKSWEDIYVDQFIALKKMDDSESSFFIKQIKILVILTDTLPNDEMWEDLDVELLTDYIKKIKWLNTEPSNQFKKKIDEFKDKAKSLEGQDWDELKTSNRMVARVMRKVFAEMGYSEADYADTQKVYSSAIEDFSASKFKTELEVSESQTG